MEKEIQKLTDDTILEIDALGKKKEEELLKL
jgi:ribosome recycling factor